MDVRSLLRQSHLSVITRHADYELARIQDVIEHKVPVDGRGDLEVALGELLKGAAVIAPAPKTLDLIGHSTPGQSLLMLGDWVLDAAKPTVTAFFRELADQEVLTRLGVYAIRLLGCQTADTSHGRATICTLSEILGLEVHGTRSLIYSAHYTAAGFRPDCEHVLVCASDLRPARRELTMREIGQRYPRSLDIDALPAAPLLVRDQPWPRRIASTAVAHDILRLVRRDAGAQMPGLLAAPSCEIALPASHPNWYHLAQVLLDGEFVRVYPEGEQQPGVVYPVEDPHALRRLVDDLPVMLAFIA
jgi:hypothetical protein